MPPAEHELSQDSFSWQPPGEGAQLSALVPPLFFVSAHAISSAVLPLPGARISGQILCQVPWAANHPDFIRTLCCGSIPVILVGRDEIISLQSTARHQLPGHTPRLSLQKEEIALLLFLGFFFCTLFFFH